MEYEMPVIQMFGTATVVGADAWNYFWTIGVFMSIVMFIPFLSLKLINRS